MTITLEPEAPVGGGEIRTFLIADVRGYTRFTAEHGDEAAAELASHFAAIARETVSAYDGQVIELRGDEALAVFSSARQAMRAAVALQQRYAGERVAATGLPFKVGIGLDAGEAIRVDGGYRGGALNLAARLCSLAGPGEVLVSEGVAHLARKLTGLRYAERGAVQLKGFAKPVRVVQVAMEEEGQEGSGNERPETVKERPLPIGGFLGALPATPLVARHEELRTVESAVDAVAGGSGRLVFLAGEPGVGKTRLAQELTLQLRNREFLVASGRCYEPQEVVPFYPFLEALATLFAAVPSSIRDAMPQRWPALARILPSEHLPAAPSYFEGKEEQERLFWSVADFLQAITEEAPVALLLDDLHWADATSLALLQHLARHTRAYRVLLLGTYRDVEVGRQHPLERALRDLNREGLVERVAIRRLEQEGTAALIATAFEQEEVSQELAGLVQRHTEGNPFFTHEVLRALVERGDIYQENNHWERREIGEIEVPESVRSAIGERLSRLSDGTQQILHVASVLGQIFAFDDLHAMTDRSEDQIEQSLEEAVTAGLIRETLREEYGFNHALTQQALYAELSGRRKRRLHLAAGEALERRGRSRTTPTTPTTRAAELARHFLEGDDPERALLYAMQAGDEAEAVFAHEEAERQYRTALELAQENGDQEREAEVQLKLGVLLKLTARYDKASPLLEGARELYAMLSNRVMEARAAAEVIGSYGARGFVEERNGALERARLLIPALEGLEPTTDLALVYQVLSRQLYVWGHFEEALALRERVVEVARALDDGRLLNRAEIDRADVLGALGCIRDAVQVAEAILPRAQRAGDLSTLEQALFTAAEFSMLAGELDKSRAYRERELAAAERISDTLRECGALANLSQVTRYQGDWEASLTYAARALAITASSEDGELPPHLLARHQRSVLLLLQGNQEEGTRELNIVADDTRNSIPQFLRYVQRDAAEHNLLTGEPQKALERLKPLVEGADSRDNDVTYLFPILAWAYLETGDSIRAAQYAEEAKERATSSQNAVALVDALRVHGMVLTREQRWEEAGYAFKEAVSLTRSMPYPYAEARALFEWGRMDRAKGQPAQARKRMEEALHIFRRLGARPDVERTEQALAITLISRSQHDAEENG